MRGAWNPPFFIPTWISSFGSEEHPCFWTFSPTEGLTFKKNIFLRNLLLIFHNENFRKNTFKLLIHNFPIPRGTTLRFHGSFLLTTVGDEKDKKKGQS